MGGRLTSLGGADPFFREPGFSELSPQPKAPAAERPKVSGRAQPPQCGPRRSPRGTCRHCDGAVFRETPTVRDTSCRKQRPELGAHRPFFPSLPTSPKGSRGLPRRAEGPCASAKGSWRAGEPRGDTPPSASFSSPRGLIHVDRGHWHRGLFRRFLGNPTLLRWRLAWSARIR